MQSVSNAVSLAGSQSVLSKHTAVQTCASLRQYSSLPSQSSSVSQRWYAGPTASASAHRSPCRPQSSPSEHSQGEQEQNESSGQRVEVSQSTGVHSFSAQVSK